MAATDVQGMLVRIEATTAQLRMEMAKADSTVAASSAGINKQLAGIDLAFNRIGRAALAAGKTTGVAMAGLATASIAAGAASLALLKRTAEATAESDRWAKSLGMNTTTLIEWQYAAERAGLSGDNIADIFKDLNDKIGDVLVTGGGEAVDALNKLGLSAKALAQLSPDKQLEAIAASLSKVGSQAEKTNILESLGNDLSRLLPLLENGGAELERYKQQARDFGISLNPQQVNDLVKANEILKDIGDQLHGIENQMVAGLANVDLSSLNDSMADLRATVTDPRFVQGLADLAAGVLKFTTFLASAASEIANITRFAAESMAAAINGPALDDLIRLEDRVASLRHELEQAKAMGGLPALFDDFGVSGSRAVKDIEADLKDAQEQLKKGQELVASMSSMKAPPIAPNPSPRATPNLAALQGRNGPDKDAEKAQAKNQQELNAKLREAAAAYVQLKRAYDPVGAALDDYTKGTEQLDLLLADNKVSLSEYATSVGWLEDQYAQAKAAANGLSEAMRYQADLEKDLANARAQYQAQADAVGMGDKEAQRSQARLELERENNQKILDLRTQRNLAETDAQRKAFDEQIRLEKEYGPKRVAAMEEGFRKVDAAQADWTNGMAAALDNYRDSVADTAGQFQELFTNAFTGAEDALVDFVTTGKLSFKDLANSIVQDLIRIQIRKALAGAVSAAAGTSWGAGVASMFQQAKGGAWNGGVQMFANGGVFTNGIVDQPTAFRMAGGLGVMGEAGPEAIMPLTRGPDGSLGVAAHGGGGGDTVIHLGAPTVHMQVNGNPDAAMLMQMEQSTQRAVKASYQAVANDFKTNGPLRRLITG
ncbi:phage tail tape measure protein [Pseudomonas oryzihabitans]|uniref:phage tail tape measure protein n=1 Tax=Pseudomonas oryzihabitans TaxID=47885 RepID=UPI0028960167|nr:phage tail tape measure protein [Pseudomonas oryzihabitans]MDT3722384.1 phage tail tape measure protein [Pseudomonas oryzihabitans]